MDSSRYRQSLYSAFSSLCSQYGENLLFRFEGRDITYAETGDLVRRRAAFLQREGYGKGDIIAMMAVNSPDWCVTFMAIAAMGGIVLPLDTSLQPEQTGPMLARAGAKAFFASRAFEGFAGDLASYEISTSGNMGDASSFSAADVSFDDMAAMLFTSGTTGNPKLVSLSHLNILHVACVCTELEEYSPSDVTLALLPLFHIYALEATFMAPMVSGSSIVMLNSLKGPDIMKALADFPITIFPAAPLMWELFFKGLTAKIGVGTTKYRIFMFFVNHAPLLKALGLGFLVRKIFDPVHAAFGRSHRFFISGGAPLKREYFTYYRNMGFRFIEGYGLSETTGPIAIPYYKNSMAGSVGCPIPGNEVKIRNINEDGIGEIWFRGDAVMKGYYSNEAANRESFDDWGFFNTGDLGRLDRKGNIYVTGRMKNVIVLDSGKKAYPEELEFYYKQSPMISEIAVIDRVSDGRVQVYGVIVPVSRSRNV
jgi:long-chain acyl-CoA synthetase